MLKIIFAFMPLLFLTFCGCVNVSPVNSAVRQAPSGTTLHPSTYDYSHTVTNRKYIIVISPDYREYSGDDLPNVDTVGTDIGRALVLNDKATVRFEEKEDQTLNLVRYYDKKAKELQDFFDENPVAMLKSELVNSGKFVVLDEATVKIRSHLKPRFIVSMNIHRVQTNGTSSARCYLNMVEIRTGRTIASSRGEGANLKTSIQKASKDILQHLD